VPPPGPRTCRGAKRRGRGPPSNLPPVPSAHAFRLVGPRPRPPRSPRARVTGRGSPCRLVPLPEARTDDAKFAHRREANRWQELPATSSKANFAVGVVGIAERVVAAEAGVAVVLGGRRRSLRRRPPSRGKASESASSSSAISSIERLWAIISSRVDMSTPVVTGVADRRRRDPQVDLLGAGVAQHADDLAGGVCPAHDRVVDDDDPLPGDDLRQWVELQPQPRACAAPGRAGIKGPRHVAVLDQAIVAWQPQRRVRSPAARRVAGVRQPRSPGRPSTGDSCQSSSPIFPRTCCSTPAPRGRLSGAGEVDVLEDAGRLALGLDHLAASPSPAPRSGLTISPGCTSRISSAPMMSKAQLSEATTKRSPKPAQRERPDPVRVAEGDDRVLGHHHRRVGALHSAASPR